MIRSSATHRTARRIALWGGRIGIGALVITVALVAPLRWIAPPTSAFIERHRFLTAGQPQRGPHYRWVDWEAMSPSLALAVVASEDQRFPFHGGIDFDAIQDALDERRAGGRRRGASTISQQVAKNLFLWPGQSFIRKGLEGYLTVTIELLWSKRRILEVYLNVAEFGDGVYGVGVASERFFDRPPSQVAPAQAALLASVLPSPKRFDATAPSDYMRKRQAWILDQMRQLGPDYLAGL